MNMKRWKRYIRRYQRIIVTLGAIGVIIIITMSALGIFLVKSLMDTPEPTGKYVKPPEIHATPSPTPQATPTPEPTPGPSPTAGQDPPGTGDNNSEFRAFQELANQSAIRNTSWSSSPMVYQAEDPMLRYPWIRYGYDDSNGSEWMWTPGKFEGLHPEGELARFTLYEYWLNTVTPHHQVSGWIEIDTLPNDPVIAGGHVSGTMRMTNSAQETIRNVTFKVTLSKWNVSTNEHYTVYEVLWPNQPINLGPGQTWSKHVSVDVPDEPYYTHTVISPERREKPEGYYVVTVRATNPDDGTLLCEASAQRGVAINHGNGIISYG